MHIAPTCKYGHGPLARVIDSPGNHRFALMGVTLPKPPEGFIQFSEASTPAQPSGRVYSIAVFRCTTCGYLELFDDEALHG